VRRWSRELSLQSDGSVSVRTPKSGVEGMDTHGHKRAGVEVYEDEEKQSKDACSRVAYKQCHGVVNTVDTTIVSLRVNTDRSKTQCCGYSAR
jgi:hypothetical protein